MSDEKKNDRPDKKDTFSSPLMRVFHRAAFALVAMMMIPTGAWSFYLDRNVRKIVPLIEDVEQLEENCITSDDVEGLDEVRTQTVLLQNDLDNLQVSLKDLQSLVRDILLHRDDERNQETP